jgi:hypothetical protein
VIFSQERTSNDAVLIDRFPLVGRSVVAVVVALAGFWLVATNPKLPWLWVVPVSVVVVTLTGRHELRLWVSERKYWRFTGILGLTRPIEGPFEELAGWEVDRAETGSRTGVIVRWEVSLRWKHDHTSFWVGSFQDANEAGAEANRLSQLSGLPVVDGDNMRQLGQQLDSLSTRGE